MKIYNVPSEIKRINRLREITMILVKYQVISAVKKLFVITPIALIAKLFKKIEELPEKKSRARLIRKILEELGTTYIKFGQWMSVRPDFVPPEIIQELEHLQDRLPPVPLKIIKRTIKQETGKSIDEIFSKFDPHPISTASIAQVHTGVLKTGEEVAVKVQLPNLKRLINVDLSILRSMADWAVRNWPHLALHRPDEALSHFKAVLMNEINFVVEAKNQERMAELFKGTSWIRIPKVHWEYTTERLLVMEYLHGLKINQLEKFKNSEWSLDRKLLVERLSDCMFYQIFELGFFHADPHPGNILFMKNNQVGFVDFGIIAKLDEALLANFIDWINAMIYRDVDLFERAFLEIGKPLTTINKIQFRNDCLDFLDEFHFQPAQRISFAKVLEKINYIVYRNKISLPSNFLFFFKAISTLEGLARRLDPEYDWREAWGPKVEKIMRARYYPMAILKKYWKVLKDYDRLMANFPEDFLEIMKKIKDGKLSIETQISMPQLDKYVADIRKSMQDFSLAIVLAAIIFGLFHMGRGQGPDFLKDVLGYLPQLWWVVILIIIILLYFRKR